jgi:hypothetical protein
LTWTQLPCVNSSCFPSFLKAVQFNHVQSCSVGWLQAITWHHLASLGHASDLWSLCFCLLDVQVVRPQKAPWATLRKLFKHVHTTKHGLLLLVSQAIDGCRWLLAILLSQQGNHTPNLSHPFLSKISWLPQFMLNHKPTQSDELWWTPLSLHIPPPIWGVSTRCRMSRRRASSGSQIPRIAFATRRAAGTATWQHMALTFIPGPFLT